MATPSRPTAEVVDDPRTVGSAFKDQYYHLQQNFPELVHLLYEDSNNIPRPQPEIKVSRPQLDGTMRLSTLSDIDDFKMLTSGGYDSIEVTSVISQDSHGGGVFVSVAGYFISKERPPRNFVQCFVLAPQDSGYFVLNDMFRFFDDLPPKANGLENDSKISFGSVCQSQSQDSQSCDDSGEIKSDSVDDSRNGNSEVYLPVVAEGEGICILNIPLNKTIGLVKEVIKKFGTIKRSTVRSVKICRDCLVEFEEADAAEKIIKASPLLIDGHTSQEEKKLVIEASQSEAGQGNIERGEEARDSKDNPFRDRKKIMEVVVRGTDVWEKLQMRARVYDSRNWEKIVDQLDTAVYDYEKLHNLAQEMVRIVEEIRDVLDEDKEKQKLENLREEEGRQYKMKETQGVDQIQEQEEEEEQNEKVESKLQEEEGQQYKQSRFRSEQMKEETPEVCEIQEEEEEEESKLQEQAEETEVDFSWTHEDIMEYHNREIEEENKKKIEEEGQQYNQNRYRIPQAKEETQEVAQVPEKEEETKKVESKLKEEGKEKEVDFSWTYKDIMEEHRPFEEEHDKAFTLFCKRMKKKLQDEQETVNQN